MQAHPWAPEFSRIAFQLRSYGVLAEVSLCCPPLKGRFPTYYSPVRHFPLPEGNFSFDLHVWSTPPAFVLSQDQTLHCQKVYVHRLFGANQIIRSTSFFTLTLFAFCSFVLNHFSKLTSFYVSQYSHIAHTRFQLFCFQCSSYLVSPPTLHSTHIFGWLAIGVYSDRLFYSGSLILLLQILLSSSFLNKF